MKNNKKNIIITISIILAISLIIGGIVLFFYKDKKAKEKKFDVINKIPDIVLKDDGVAKYVDGSEVDTKVKEENDVFEVLEEVGGLFKIKNPKDVLSIKSTRTSADFTYYRLSQKYNNVKVYGHELNIAVDKDNNVSSITGDYFPIEYVSTSSSISIEEMEQKLSELLGEEIEVLEKDRYIYIKEDKAIYSYIYSVITSGGLYEVAIDAKEATILDKLFKSYSSDYSYTGKDIYGEERTISINDMAIGGYQLHDNNRNISIVNATNIGDDLGTMENKKWLNAIGYLIHVKLRQAPAVVDMCSDGTLSTTVCITSDDNFIRNSILAMHNFSVTYDYYKNLGSKSYDNNGSEIFVNIGMVNDLFGSEEFFNAYWSSGYSIFAFGSKDGVSLASQLDVVAHEYTHAVQGNISGLQYQGESGALNEAYSDILGSLIEGKNFQINEGMEEFRDMANPNKYGDPAIKGEKYYFPTDRETYNDEWIRKQRENNEDLAEDWTTWDHSGVHTNSGVPNYAAFLMYDNGAFKNKEEMAKVWYNSLFLLGPTSNFEDCALAVIKTAKQFKLTEDKIKIIEEAFVTTKMLDREYASLSGKVTSDNTKKPLQGVSVVAINKLNSHVSYETTTDEDGEYLFKELPVVEYVLTFELPKYESYEQEVTLISGENKVNVSLNAIEEGSYKQKEVVFVLDISLSMDETDPTDIRKQIMSNVVSSLDSNTKVALVVFAKNGQVVNNGLSDKSVDKKILITDIFNMANDSGHTDNSGTNGRAGIEKGLLLFTDDVNSRKYIVFLTDGEDNQYSGPTYDELIEQANKKDVRILAIGLVEDDQINEEILKNIANKTKGKYYHADKSVKLHEFDKKIFEELE